MIYRIDTINECTGCRACAFICEQKAIEFAQNQEGFYIPIIDSNKCINCGLCYKKCPQNNERLYKIKGCYFAWNKNFEERKTSSSGGIFPVLAKYILNEHGYICAAGFDNNLVLRHIIVSNYQEIDPLKGSKYVQSLFIDYNEIKEKLETGKDVLVIGTPCEIGGIKNVFSAYENLFTVEILCHGVTSPLFFHKYIEVMEKKFNGKIYNINFRNKKKYGWSCGAGITYQLSETTKMKEGVCDEYYTSFLQGVSFQESCYKCNYKKSKRDADITIGDGWKVEKIYPMINSKWGSSIILINSIKGFELFNKISNNIVYYPVSFENAIKCNLSILNVSKRPEQRNEFYYNINNISSRKFISNLKKKTVISGFIAKIKRKIFFNFPFVIKYFLRIIMK